MARRAACLQASRGVAWEQLRKRSDNTCGLIGSAGWRTARGLHTRRRGRQVPCRPATGAPCTERVLRVSLLSGFFAQLDAVRKLQRVWDELDAVDGLAEERGGSGLTLVDSIGGSSTWSLWNRIAKKLEVAPPPPQIRGLYLYGQHTALPPLLGRY